MFTKISVLIPSRKRLNRLATMLESYEQMDDGASELVFRLDDDDPETKRAVLGHTAVIGPRLQGYRSMGTYFNEMLDASTGDVFLCGNDDMVFVTPGWASCILEEANKYPDGVFDFGVRVFNEDHYPFSIVSRRVTDRLGFIWDPRIYWGDIFLRDVMGTLQRLFMLDVRIEHDWVGHAPDQTFIEENQQDIFRRDPTYWAGTHALAVSEAVSKVRELMA